MTDHVTDRSLLSGRVKRYNTWPTITSQTVGDHTWGVYHVYWRIFGLPPDRVALYIHLHDAEELVSGDNPFPMSRDFPSLRRAKDEMEAAARERLALPAPGDYGITDLERAQVKMCDLLEMMCFGMQEREMGNLLATPIVERTADAVLELGQRTFVGILHTRYDALDEFVQSEMLRHQTVLEKRGSTR